jgi:tetratricopeptide (TPR) repeat protein
MQSGAADPSQQVDDALSNARELHQSGRLDEAEVIYKRVLERNPRDFKTLLLLAALEHQRERDRGALELIERALRVNSQSAEALLQHAMILRSLQKPEDALASYDAALAIAPDVPAALYNRGNLLQSLGLHEKALASYDHVLTLQPHDADVLNNRAVVLQKLGRFEAALESCQRALSVRPGYAHALTNRGHALQALGRFDEALRDYEAALRIDPDHVDALTGCGAILFNVGRFAEALASHERAFRFAPGALGAVHVGDALHALGRHDDAVGAYDRALEIDSNCIEALNNRGNALQALNRHEEALASYITATEIAPDDAHAHWNEGLVRLLLGDYERGWQKYEWRWKNRQLNASPRLSDKPQWQGHEDIAGKTVLVHAEQGFGDAIQFIRYVPLLAARGAAIVVACHESLREIFGSIEGVHEITTSERALPRFDYHVPLVSLPYAFKTVLGDIPAQMPYLSARVDAVEAWHRKLAAHTGLKIGLAWMGNPKFTAAGAKACRLEQLRIVLDQPGCNFVSLQKGEASADIEKLGLASRIADYTADVKTFSDTAALITNLDLVISIDTAVAHLAGALAKPVWILLPFAADWRWLRDREDSPWYPSARLFRQSRPGDWDGVLREVREALQSAAMRPARAP